MIVKLIYYNPNHNCFYCKNVRDFTNPNYYVGYVNQFQHQIVQIFHIRDGKLINCNNYWDYIKKSREEPEPKHSLIDEIARVLNIKKK